MSSKLDIKKFPELEILTSQLDAKKQLIDLYKQRIGLINNNLSELNEYDKNERLILLNITNREMAKLQRIIQEDEKKINQQIDSLSKIVKDYDANSKSIEKQYINLFGNDKNRMSWFNDVKIETNYLAKLSLFVQMQQEISNFTNPKKNKITPEFSYDIVMQLFELLKQFYVEHEKTLKDETTTLKKV